MAEQPHGDEEAVGKKKDGGGATRHQPTATAYLTASDENRRPVARTSAPLRSRAARDSELLRSAVLILVL